MLNLEQSCAKVLFNVLIFSKSSHHDASTNQGPSDSQVFGLVVIDNVSISSFRAIVCTLLHDTFCS